MVGWTNVTNQGSHLFLTSISALWEEGLLLWLYLILTTSQKPYLQIPSNVNLKIKCLTYALERCHTHHSKYKMKVCLKPFVVSLLFFNFSLNFTILLLLIITESGKWPFPLCGHTAGPYLPIFSTLTMAGAQLWPIEYEQ